MPSATERRRSRREVEAFDQIGASLVQRRSRCGALTDLRQFLDCYYGAAQPLRSQLGLPPAPAAQQRLAAGVMGIAPANPAGASAAAPPSRPAVNPEPNPAASFGLPVQPRDSERVTARMTSFSFDRFGFFTATLSNGQVWVQEDGDTLHAPWSKPADKFVYNVSVSHGLLGSYNLRVVGMTGAYKVKRLR